MSRHSLQAAQRSMLSYEKLFPGTTTYHHCVVVEIHGEINVPYFSEALQLLAQRHTVLRSKVVEDATGAYLETQVDAESSSSSPKTPTLQVIPAQHEELSDLTDFYNFLIRLNVAKLIEEPFRFHEEPLWRAALIQLTPNRHCFFLVQHHIITDTHSTGILLRDLSIYYNSLLARVAPTLPSIPNLESLSFDLADEEREKRLHYWRNTLHGLSTIQLPTDKKEEVFRFVGERIPFKIGPELVSALNVKIPGYSFNVIMLAVLYTFLFRYTQEKDISLGITSANRRHDNVIDRTTLSNIANCFINSVSLRVQLDSSMPFKQLLPQIKAKQKEALEHQLPIDEVMQALSFEDKQSLGTASPFNIMLVVNDHVPIPTLSLTGTTAGAPYEVDTKHSKFPYLGFNLTAHNDSSYQGFVEFNSDLFNAATISELIIPRFLKILNHVAANPECTLADIPILLPNEALLIERLNATNSSSPDEKYVQDYFNFIAKQYPNNVAFVYHDAFGGSQQCTYRECDNLSTALGNYLLQLNKVSQQKTVGICIKRSHHLFTIALAVLKAGYAFVMLDTDHTAARNHKISSADVQIVIVDNHTESLFTDNRGVTLVNIFDKAVSDQLIETEYRYLRNVDGELVNLDSATAYIMFTSGTTGQPKGVRCSHAGFSNLLYALKEYLHTYNIDEPLKVISIAPCIFDAFLWDLLLALATKGTVHIRAQLDQTNTQSQEGILTERIILQENITAGAFLPAHLRTFSDEAIKKFKFLVTMGSAAYLETLKHIRAISPQTLLVNGYGPTEATIDCAHHAYREGDLSSIIGTPLRNMKLHILDPYLRVCPLGVPGEIYIEGPGVAKGYLAQDSGVDNKFLSLTYNERTHAFELPRPSSRRRKLYRTGDHAVNLLIERRALPSIIGRIDREVKIFGNRVNLGEIEAVLRQNEDYVQDIVLVARPTGVIAYVIPPPSKQGISPEEMQKNLRDFLNKTPCKPAAKPQMTVVMESFPLTANGKININELKPPSAPALEQPKTELQAILRSLWSSVLGLPEISISTAVPFEDYGGNSLARVSLLSRINKHQAQLGLSRPFKISSLSPATTISSLESSILHFQRLRTPSLLPNSPQRSLTHGQFFKNPTPRALGGSRHDQPLGSRSTRSSPTSSGESKSTSTSKSLPSSPTSVQHKTTQPSSPTSTQHKTTYAP